MVAYLNTLFSQGIGVTPRQTRKTPVPQQRFGCLTFVGAHTLLTDPFFVGNKYKLPTLFLKLQSTYLRLDTFSRTMETEIKQGGNAYANDF